MTSPTSQSIVLRHATASDRRALDNLAALDSQRLGEGPFVVVEIDGEMRSAMSLGRDGQVIADPFRHTAHLVELLRTHAAAEKAANRKRTRLSDRPRLALGF